MQANKKILITGGAGFIGSHLLHLFVNKYAHYQIVNVDALTYAANMAFIKDLEKKENYTFIKGTINDFGFVKALFEKHNFDSVIHLAAESHVDRSIANPFAFVHTNILGTLNLLEAARKTWKNLKGKLFYQISTDEVYGSLAAEGKFSETSPYQPNSPYAASKASADHLLRAYANTYQIPFVLSHCSNNYGPNQHREKLIPTSIYQILHKKNIPVYGDGQQIRDWLFVTDHCQAIDLIFHKGRAKNTYHIGGSFELKNLDLIHLICDHLDKKLGRKERSKNLITFVTDRKGHDKRYAMDTTKIERELGWVAATDFQRGIERTINWYLNYFKNSKK